MPPAKRKEPQDHKKPANTVKAEADGADLHVTVQGAEYVLTREAMDDFEVVEELAQIDAGDFTKVPSVLTRILGREQYLAMKDNLRDPETGRISNVKVGEFFQELFQAADPNSLPSSS